MGVRNTTNDGKCALFDSTSGIAFGPVFDSEQECDDFIEYADQIHGIDDVRTINHEQLIKLHEAFTKAQEEDDDE